MAEDGQKLSQDELIEKLVRETGITEAQALELIAFLGRSWSSLVREAKYLLGPR